MTDRVTEIANRWAGIPALSQCEDWWYSAIRHCQRNVEELCAHEHGEGRDDQPDVHPGRYDGEPYAHAAADIHYLLGQLKP